MKLNTLTLVLCLVAHSLNMYADNSRQDTVKVESESSEIHLSPSFQKELWNAFSFTPMEAPLESSYSIPLDRSLMKEWLSSVPIKAEIQPLDLPGVITKSTGINPYIWMSKHSDLGIMVNGNGATVLTGLDINALAKYIRPSEIKLRKMQEIAKDAREVMDRCFPMEGLATPVPSDTARAE